MKHKKLGLSHERARFKQRKKRSERTPEELRVLIERDIEEGKQKRLFQ